MTNLQSDRIHRCETQLRDFLKESLQSVSREALSNRVVAGKWSALENLAHLARYHEVFLERLDRILSEVSPALGRYRAEEDPGWEAWRGLPADHVLEKMESLRLTLVEKLKSLGESDFHRKGVHPKLGAMTLSLWLEFFLSHEGHHLYIVLQQLRAG